MSLDGLAPPVTRVRGLQQRSETMKTLCALALIALAVGCHLDKLFTEGGRNGGLSRGTPVGLSFSADPAPGRAGQPLDPVRVAVVDSAGTPVVGADSLITIALGTNAGSGTLSGTDTAHAVNGMATFQDLRIDQPGTYTLRAAGGGFPPRDSKPFEVMPPTPTTGSISVTTSTSGTNIDPDGYIATMDGAASQPIGTGATVTFGGLSAVSHSVALSGVASNCSVTGSNPQSVDVPAGGTAQVTFTVVCAPPVPTGRATHLAFTGLGPVGGMPQSAQVGQVMRPVRVSALDAAGQIVTDFSGTITVNIQSNPGGGTLRGTRSLTIDPSWRGVAEYLDLSIDQVGNDYTLGATSPGLLDATSNPFDITAGPPPAIPGGATGLGFLQPPSATRAGAVMSPVRVVVTDDAGHAVTSFNLAITISIISNPGGGTLLGTRRVDAVNGIAVFSDLRIDRPGSGYTLRVSHSSLNDKTSDPFDITP